MTSPTRTSGSTSIDADWTVLHNSNLLLVLLCVNRHLSQQDTANKLPHLFIIGQFVSSTSFLLVRVAVEHRPLLSSSQDNKQRSGFHNRRGDAPERMWTLWVCVVRVSADLYGLQRFPPSRPRCHPGPCVEGAERRTDTSAPDRRRSRRRR